MSAFDDDDEDAFLYGNTSSSNAVASSSSGVPLQAAVPSASTPGLFSHEGTPASDPMATMPPTTNPPMSLTENGTASLVKASGDAGEKEQDGDDGMDESDEEEEEESDDDLEIIMDINPNAPAPSHDFSRRMGAVPVRPPPPAAVQAQNQVQSAASPQPVKQESVGPSKTIANPFLSFPTATIRRTGAPIPTPGRSPAPDVNSTSATYTQRAGSAEPDVTPLDFKPIVQPIIDVDLDSIDEKRWRRPGANVADYFNYGFDEASWKAWCSRQKLSREERERERENPFQVFANRPLPDAWSSLPMELKGMMMQTIMTSFSQPGGQMQPGMGAAGMQGMMPGMAGMGGMNMGMATGGMANNFGGMGGGQQQGMGMNGQGGGFQGMHNFGNQGAGNMGMGMNPMMQRQLQQGNMSGGGTPNPQMQQQGLMQQGTPHGSEDYDGDNADNESQNQPSNYDDEEVDPNELPHSNPLKRPASSDFTQQQGRPNPGNSSFESIYSGPQQQQGAFGRGRGNMRGGGFQGQAGRGGLMPLGQQRGQSMMRGRGGHQMSPPVQAHRQVSPLPDNLPKGPKSMQAGGRR